MKKLLYKKSHVYSVLSLGLLGLFLLMAVGSDDLQLMLLAIYSQAKHEYDQQYDIYKYNYSNPYKTVERTYEGQKDSKGYWQGEVRISATYQHKITGEKITAIETVNMVNGLRHGQSRMDYPGEKIRYRYYIMGDRTSYFQWNDWETYANRNQKKGSTASISSAYQWLSDSYPWFVFAVEFTGYDSVYLENYLDTLELILQSNTFGPDDFNDYYDSAIVKLRETPYDSIIQVNAFLSFLQGLDALRSNELRLAILDRYYNQAGSTFDIVADNYPNYLEALVVEAGVPETDFAVFCEKLDSAMNSYGILDLEDPFFIDSVDAYMYRAIFDIYESGETLEIKSTRVLQVYRSGGLKTFLDPKYDISATYGLKSSHSMPAEVAEVILYTIIMKYLEGDLMKKAVHNLWLEQNGIASLPTVVTSFSLHNSATSVTLVGFVSSDGGARVSTRGIAWANHYNPTSTDYSLAAGTDTGLFDVNLTGLTEGESYYARAYATNSVGTSYGNCIMFTATNTVGMDQEEAKGGKLGIYPNPATSYVKLECPHNASGTCRLQILDMGGRLLQDIEMGRIETVGQQFHLDLNGLKDGSYICKLVLESGKVYSARLLIAH
jgi:hypothetical protein